MPPLLPGFYVATAPNAADLAATDLVGPFASLWDLCAWLADFDVRYMPWRQRAKCCVLYAAEMTGEESNGVWATGVCRVAPQYARNAAS